MKNRLALLWLAAALGGAAPAPLVAGAVRDQFGEPIAAATVRAGAARTTTGPDGTFALPAQARQVRITCAYCRPTQAAVAADGTVAAIVERYHALVSQAPSPRDLAALPYAHVESVLALTPFVVLDDSSNVLPGPRLALYGLLGLGGLPAADGIPPYDFAAGITPLRQLPEFGAWSAQPGDPSQAFRYGDLAGAGTFFVQTTPQAGGAGAALAGTQQTVVFGRAGSRASYSLADSAGDLDSRARAVVAADTVDGADTFSATAIAARDRDLSFADQTFAGSTSALRVHWDRASATHAYADLTADRSAYGAALHAFGASGGWSDTTLTTGVSSNGPISAFADLSARFSSGYYDTTGTQPRIAGTALETHVDAGAQYHGDRFAWSAGIGAFEAAYSGGTLGVSTPLSARMATPSAWVSYGVSPQWNLSAGVSESFRLPSLLEAYASEADEYALAYDRYSQRSATLEFTDRHRLRASVTGLKAHVSDLDEGDVAAVGASLAWQIAPSVSLRAWTMHFDDTTRPYADLQRFGAAPVPATPASVWVTYESPRGLRADAIWRNDLIDYRPDPHVDASISAPLDDGVRWFAATERRLGRRSIEFGLRLQQR